MALSNSTNFNLTRNEIIELALGALGESPAEETVAGTDLILGNKVLNMLIKMWQADGVNLWKYKEATLFLTNGTATYDLGSTARAAETVVETTTSAAAISGASTITVTTATGMAASDKIGIILDSGDTQWTTISSIASSTITLATTLTGAVASGNRVYTYTTAISRPMEIKQLRLRNDSNFDRPMETISRQTYFNQVNKTTESTPLQYFYDVQLTKGTLYLYPTPNVDTDRIKFTYVKTLDDFDSATNDPDFPQEWLMALVLNLATWLCYWYGKEEKLPALIPAANHSYQVAKKFNVQEESTFIGAR